MPNQHAYNTESGRILGEQSEVWNSLERTLKPEQRLSVFIKLLRTYRTIPGLRNLSKWLVEHKEFSKSIPKYERKISGQLIHVLENNSPEIKQANQQWGV